MTEIENNRNFKCGDCGIEDNGLYLFIDDEFIGEDGYIVLLGNEKENIEKIKKAAKYFAGLADDLRRAAKLYKSPKLKKEKKAK